MTEETRAELRDGIEAVVRAFGLKDTILVTTGAKARPAGHYSDAVEITAYVPDGWTVEQTVGLTTAQQLALSVLLGDEAVLPDALADYLIDKGHEYAVAVAEKARREERERIVGLIRAWADDAYDAGEAEQAEMLSALVEVVEE